MTTPPPSPRSRPRGGAAAFLPLFLLLPSLLLAFVRLPEVANGQRYDVTETLATLVERRRIQVYDASDSCVSTLGTSLGFEFLSCVLDRLLERRKDEKNGAEEEDPFPVPPYRLRPLTFERVSRNDDGPSGANHGLMLLDLLRNYTCGRIDDGGSAPVEVLSWTYDEREELNAGDGRTTCPSAGVDEEEEEGGGTYVAAMGYLPAGDDVGTEEDLTLEESKAHCDHLPGCEGFTFDVPPNANDDDDDKAAVVFFKGRASLGRVRYEERWRSYVRREIPDRCLSSDADAVEEGEEEEEEQFDPPVDYRVEILRHEPLVALVPSFASDSDCSLLQEAGGADSTMSRAEEFGSGRTSYRRSYSDNIFVDYEDRSHPVTRFAERMFAFVRNVTGYDVRGPGQEPINAVLYKNAGDEYRPHCDGPCHGGRYPPGARVATSILYCDIPMTYDGKSSLGGQTSFTRSGMMIVPRKGDLLLFAYKYPNNTMDDGYTEHSGCPIQEGGRKWIATQWYREGVNYERPWSFAQRTAGN